MWKWFIVFALLLGVSPIGFAAPIVSDISARQRYPWNGLVDVKFKVSGIESPGPAYMVQFLATNVVSRYSRNEITMRTLQLNGVEIASLDKDNGMFYEVANGSYHFIWNARQDLGEVNYSDVEVRVNLMNKDLYFDTPVQLWEGGPYWAKSNIGAKVPEDVGYFFQFGDTVGCQRIGSIWAFNSSSAQVFSFESTYWPMYEFSATDLEAEGWLRNGELPPKHDVATVYRGNNWRMPTKAEMQALLNNCTWQYTYVNNVVGWLVSGKGAYANNNIFLPQPNRAIGEGYEAIKASSYYSYYYYGWYWTSSFYVPSWGNSNNYAYALSFEYSCEYSSYSAPFASGEANRGRVEIQQGYYGGVVRPVREYK